MGDLAKRALAATAAARSGPPEVWIAVVGDAAVEVAAAAVEARLEAGEPLPLGGMTLAVKDNIDVAGLPTTAGCPAFAFLPDRDAPAVAAMVDAGAVVVGKTNMDQFATGLVGTRSPYGVVRNAVDPRYIAGGSSSGSAVAVALGQVDLALGTDTAGSGRVPAALNGIVGFKPSRGLVSTEGVVPACRSLDCVSFFATTVMAARAGAAAAFRRELPPPGAVPGPRLGIPRLDQVVLAGERRASWLASLDRLAACGYELETLDITGLLDAGRLLYEGSLVAERYAAVGSFVVSHPGQVDPVVRQIVLDAAAIPAHAMVRDLERLTELRREVGGLWARLSAVVLPGTSSHPRVEEIREDPFGHNRDLGLYTHFANPLDLCAATVPAGRTVGGLPLAVTFYGPSMGDLAVLDVASVFVGEPSAPAVRPAPATRSGAPGSAGGHHVAVVGAHLRGQPLHGELLSLGARFVEETATAPLYRLYALPTIPPKPGLARAGSDGCRIAVEIWSLDSAGMAGLVASVAVPLAVGPVELAGGRTVTGFVCQAGAEAAGEDISRFGGWRAYLSSLRSTGW